IPSIIKQIAFVDEQRKRFADINNYEVKLSSAVNQLRDELTAQMRKDTSGWQEILLVPEQMSDKL
ncbi:MAG: hypothetical protein DMF69_01710, partial [Acidobacteria bacterium]